MKVQSLFMLLLCVRTQCISTRRLKGPVLTVIGKNRQIYRDINYHFLNVIVVEVLVCMLLILFCSKYGKIFTRDSRDFVLKLNVKINLSHLVKKV